MKKYITKENIFYLIIFIFFLTLSILMPLTGDDWGNYTIGKNGTLMNLINEAAGMYLVWEGRFISRIFINILTYHKIFFDIILALLMTSFTYISPRIIKIKNKTLVILLTTLIFLLFENSIFTQTVLWVAGSITYMFPTLLIFIYAYILFKYILKRKYKWYDYLFCICFSFFIPMFVENIGCAFVFANILLYLYELIKNKKKDKLLLFTTIFSIIGLIIMLLSPGSAQRAAMESEHLPLITSLIKGIVYFINYTFIKNTYLILLMSLVNIKLLRKNKSKNIIFYIFTIIGIILGLINLINDLGYSLLPSLIYFKNPYVNIYWIIYFLISIYIFIKNYSKNNNFYKLLLILLTGLCANAVMIIVPTWGGRTTLFTTILLTLFYIYLLDDLSKENKKLNIALIVFICLLIPIYSITYYNVYKFNKFQEKSINTQIKENKKEITIYTLPDKLACTLIPGAEYHINTYKVYYGIDNETTLIFAPSNWKYNIIFKGI